MTGLEAITNQNGWAMALVGACIVFSGLSILAFVISRLQTITALLEKKPDSKPGKKAGKAAAKVEPKSEIKIPSKKTAPILNFTGVEGDYKPLTMDIGGPFQLSHLYTAAEKENLPHPHLSIKHLRETGILTSVGDGAFIWASDNK